MGWFKNIKVGKRIMLAFGLVVAVNVGVSIVSIRAQSDSIKRSEHMYYNGAVALGHYMEIKESIQQLRVLARDCLRTKTDDELEAKINAAKKEIAEIDDNMAKVEQTMVSAEAKTHFGSMQTLWKDYKPVYNGILELAATRQSTSAWALIDGEASAKMRLVRDALEVSTDDKITLVKNSYESNKSSANQALTVVLCGSIAAIAASVALALTLTKGITRPLNELFLAAGSISQGDLDVHIEHSSKDELGKLADSFREQVRFLSGTIAEISTTGGALSSSSHEMSATASQLGAAAEETTSQANVVTSASEEVNRNIQGVAAAADEMIASIREIAVNSTNAAKATEAAVKSVSSTREVMVKLGDSSTEIGNVVKLINTIAEQTNLLALNATIEAARAGEAGKGFAVVANEVKELANQTAKATAEISSKINAIQGSATGAVDAIKEIETSINRVNEYNTTIASAMEEQSATASEVGRNMGEAARSSTEITSNVTAVTKAAQQTAEGATQTHQAAEDLAKLSTKLSTLVAQFKVSNDGKSGRSTSHTLPAAPHAATHTYKSAA